MVSLPFYQVDAFTSSAFGGNPAAVMPLTEWLPDATLLAIAEENNLAETAFFVPQRNATGGEDFHLRWFTPVVEMDLCGHATLASAEIILNHLQKGRDKVAFHTRSGVLAVTRDGQRLTMDFPTRDSAPAPADRSAPSAGSATATPEIMNGGANCAAASAGTRKGWALEAKARNAIR